MSNITLAIDDELLETARRYASAQGATLNGLVRHLLERTVRKTSTDWVDELDGLFTELTGDSKGRRWTRDELHERGPSRQRARK